MPLSVADYLIDQSSIDWPRTLGSWSWLLPHEFTLWMVNRFADLFLVFPGGTVHMLDTGTGTLMRVAESRDDFCSRIDEEDNASQWLMIPLVDQAVAAGMVLQPGHCYAFKLLPVFGGQYAVENIVPLPICDYLIACGSIHNQLQDVPDGAQVVMDVINMPEPVDHEADPATGV